MKPLPERAPSHHVLADRVLWVYGAPSAKVATERSSASWDPARRGRRMSQRGCDSAWLS